MAIDDDRIAGLIPQSVDSLAPDASVTLSADPYGVAAADVGAGRITNGGHRGRDAPRAARTRSSPHPMRS